MMPIAIGDEYYEDEFEYTAKVLGIELPQATESKPKEASGSSQTQGGTQVPPKDLNASAGNVEGVSPIVEERYQTWPERMVRGAISAMALPGDVFSGKVKAGSQEEINRAFELAGLMVMGPAPVASKLADGTLGSFAGVKSKTLNKEKLYEAQNLETAGASADDLWPQTGFMRGADGRWKYEIDDSKAAFKEGAIKLTRIGAERKARDEAVAGANGNSPRGWESTGGEKPPEYMHELAKEGVPLSEIFDHPELYEAYPFLKDIKVKATSGFDAMAGIQGYFNPKKNELAVGFATPSEMKSVMLHEIQHVIQKHEGFSFGASPEAFKSDNWKELSTAYNQYVKDTEKTIKEFFPDKPSKFNDFREALKKESELDKLAERASYGPASKEQYEKVLENLEILNRIPQLRENVEKILKGEDIVSRMNKALLEKYKSVKGEVEARNVQTRMKLTAEERRARSPKSTQSHADEEQVDSPFDE